MRPRGAARRRGIRLRAYVEDLAIERQSGDFTGVRELGAAELKMGAGQDNFNCGHADCGARRGGARGEGLRGCEIESRAAV